MIEYLIWDSNFFGYKIGKYFVKKNTDIPELISTVKNTDYKLVYLVVNQNIPNILEIKKNLSKPNIILADEKILYSQYVPEYQESVNNLKDIKLYSSMVANQKLINLSLQSGVYSRFKIDKNFVSNEYEKLYTAWIENSVNKKIADNVFVAYQENEIIGVITLAFKNTFSDIGILAVDKSYRGKKTGKKLIQKAIEETRQKGINQIKVVTQQSNQQACAFYRKQGFLVEKVEYIYHIWL